MIVTWDKKYDTLSPVVETKITEQTLSPNFSNNIYDIFTSYSGGEDIKSLLVNLLSFSVSSLHTDSSIQTILTQIATHDIPEREFLELFSLHIIGDDQTMMLYSQVVEEWNEQALLLLNYCIQSYLLSLWWAVSESDDLWMVMINKIDSVHNTMIDTHIFWHYFHLSDKIFQDSIVTHYIANNRSIAEAHTIGDHIIINTSTVNMNAEANMNLYPTTHTNYLNAVKNNEILHAILYKKYGHWPSDNTLPLWTLSYWSEYYSYKAVHASEFLSDALAVESDMSYLYTPLSFALESHILQSEIDDTYWLSQFIFYHIAGEVYIDQPIIRDTLQSILVSAKNYIIEQKYNNNELIDIYPYINHYLTVFFKNLQQTQEVNIRKKIRYYSTQLLQQFEDVYNIVQ